EAFASTHPTPQVHAARHRRPLKKLLEPRRARLLEVHPLIVVSLQAGDRRFLSGIRLIPTLGKQLSVILAYVHEIVDSARQRASRLPALCEDSLGLGSEGHRP